jgi:hypothetical protein
MVAYAHARDCLVVLDAKRGDIAATSKPAGRLSVSLSAPPSRRRRCASAVLPKALFPAAAATGSFSAWKSAFSEQLDRQIEDIAENLSNPKPAAA